MYFEFLRCKVDTEEENVDSTLLSASSAIVALLRDVNTFHCDPEELLASILDEVYDKLKLRQMQPIHNVTTGS